MEYEVFGILEREEGTYYQIKSLSCRHSGHCEVLIKWGDNNKLKYVSMLNEDDEDCKDTQYYWHTDEWQDFYYTTKKEALERVYQRSIKSCEEKILDYKKLIKTTEESILKYKEKLKGLE
jgi:hypothetical protein